MCTSSWHLPIRVQSEPHGPPHLHLLLSLQAAVFTEGGDLGYLALPFLLTSVPPLPRPPRWVSSPRPPPESVSPPRAPTWSSELLNTARANVRQTRPCLLFTAQPATVSHSLGNIQKVSAQDLPDLSRASSLLPSPHPLYSATFFFFILLLFS